MDKVLIKIVTKAKGEDTKPQRRIRKTMDGIRGAAERLLYFPLRFKFPQIFINGDFKLSVILSFMITEEA